MALIGILPPLSEKNKKFTIFLKERGSPQTKGQNQPRAKDRTNEFESIKDKMQLEATAKQILSHSKPDTFWSSNTAE